MNEYELINLTYYNPKEAILFKAGKSDRERVTLYWCCNKDNCEAYKNNTCIQCNGLFGMSCPYGKKDVKEGYTKAAKKCGELVSLYKKEHENILYKLEYISRICKIGDYVYLNLPHLNNMVNPIYNKEMFFNDKLIKKEYFTPEFIIKLLEYNPRALIGGVIHSYQDKDIPLFSWQLKRYMFDEYNKVLSKYSRIENLARSVSFVGKKAKVKTLDKGLVKIGIYIFDWDGEYLRGKGKDLDYSLQNNEEILIKPNDDTYVKVYDDNTVTESTVFEKD